jgi:hypothetical protein
MKVFGAPALPKNGNADRESTAVGASETALLFSIVI